MPNLTIQVGTPPSSPPAQLSPARSPASTTRLMVSQTADEPSVVAPSQSMSQSYLENTERPSTPTPNAVANMALEDAFVRCPAPGQSHTPAAWKQLYGEHWETLGSTGRIALLHRNKLDKKESTVRDARMAHEATIDLELIPAWIDSAPKSSRVGLSEVQHAASQHDIEVSLAKVKTQSAAATRGHRKFIDEVLKDVAAADLPYPNSSATDNKLMKPQDGPLTLQNYTNMVHSLPGMAQLAEPKTPQAARNMLLAIDRHVGTEHVVFFNLGEPDVAPYLVQAGKQVVERQTSNEYIPLTVHEGHMGQNSLTYFGYQRWEAGLPIPPKRLAALAFEFVACLENLLGGTTLDPMLMHRFFIVFGDMSGQDRSGSMAVLVTLLVKWRHMEELPKSVKDDVVYLVGQVQMSRPNALGQKKTFGAVVRAAEIILDALRHQRLMAGQS